MIKVITALLATALVAGCSLTGSSLFDPNVSECQKANTAIKATQELADGGVLPASIMNEFDVAKATYSAVCVNGQTETVDAAIRAAQLYVVVSRIWANYN